MKLQMPKKYQDILVVLLNVISGYDPPCIILIIIPVTLGNFCVKNSYVATYYNSVISETFYGTGI